MLCNNFTYLMLHIICSMSYAAYVMFFAGTRRRTAHIFTQEKCCRRNAIDDMRTTYDCVGLLRNAYSMRRTLIWIFNVRKI